MLKTLGIVDACFRSEDARAKASRKMGGKSVLEWVVRRTTDCQQLDGVIVVTTQEPENDFVSALTPLDVPVFVGTRPDPLGCLAAALEAFPAEALVRLDAASPFVDPALVDSLAIVAEARPQCDYAGYASRDGRPATLSPVGVYAEWVKTKALHAASKKARAADDRENPTRFIYSHPEKFAVHLIPAPAGIDRDDVRLRLDIEEDWDHALTIFDALGPEALDWQRIADLLVHQPALRKRMAALNRVHAEG